MTVMSCDIEPGRMMLTNTLRNRCPDKSSLSLWGSWPPGHSAIYITRNYQWIKKRMMQKKIMRSTATANEYDWDRKCCLFERVIDLLITMSPWEKSARKVEWPMCSHFRIWLTRYTLINDVNYNSQSDRVSKYYHPTRFLDQKVK